jgi:ABC-2 type transport system ATP-binding protein
VSAVFEATEVVKRYGDDHALDGVSIEVQRGELFGLLGPNGAGKTTLVKIGCGLVRPTSGKILISGHRPRSVQARRAIGYLAELFRFPGWLRADEVLSLHQQLTSSNGGAAERAELLDLVGLDYAATRRVEKMSKGMQQRLGIAQALIGSPDLLLLDEPTSALDPAGRHTIRMLLERLRSRGVTVLLNSHLLSEVELVCDRVAILLDGRVVTEGSPGDLIGGSGVEVVTDAGTTSYPKAQRADVPGIVASLVAEGRSIYEVKPTKRTLEQVYLEAVGGRMG